MICFRKGPLVLRYAIFQSIFHKFVFIDLRRICQRTKVGNLVFIICSLLVGIDCD